MMQKILVIGGTNFIGRNLVEKLLSNPNYDLYLFNRGVTNAAFFPSIKKIVGDRNSDDVKKIHEHEWDYVIDVSCYFPNSLATILEGISDNIKKYILISTCSVYEDENLDLVKENAPIKDCNTAQSVDISNSSYGNRKAECERVMQSSSFNYTILRPALVYGRYDHTDRFYYWLHQAKKYDSILIPNEGKQMISLTYVNDLVDTIITAISESPDRNAYNITTTTQVSIEQILKIATSLLKTKPTFFSANSEFLVRHKIGQWTDMPIWIDSDYSTCDNQKILDQFDLEFTDFETTVKETIQHYDSLNWHIPEYGMDRQKQVELLEKV